MLKYQVRNASSSRPELRSTGSTSSGISLGSRSPSISSLSSLESIDGETGVLKIYTWNVAAFSDYKALRIHLTTTVAELIDILVSKFKLSARDPNLFEMFMEVKTRHEGRINRSFLLLHPQCRPLEMHRCHPADDHRFIVHLRQGGTLVRVYDHHFEPQSNYKSVLLAGETNAETATRLVISMNRREPTLATQWALYVEREDGESAQIPPEAPLVSISKMLCLNHRILLKKIPPNQL
ncbi:unnamed protein product, partial [Mesorhabditis belari]|uniref:Ras-associating domain-containing protein n=1 Tax=Mesorhabditis belari TaxID=2138241 RepID=A0AAF3ECZ6_9BILA